MVLQMRIERNVLPPEIDAYILADVEPSKNGNPDRGGKGDGRDFL